MLLIPAPNKSPAARSGAFIQPALTVVNTSGSDVAVDIKTTPIHKRPSPVNSAISSPYRESLVPARTITTALIRNTPYAVSTARPLPTQ